MSRVQQLTVERDQLAEEASSLREASAHAVGSQQRLAELQQQVDALLAEKAAAEHFKAATIAELRRENAELRASLQEQPAASSPPHTSGDASRAAELQATVSALQVEASQLRSQAQQLATDKAALERQVQDLRAGRGVLVGSAVLGAGAGAATLGRHRSPAQRIAELEAELAGAQADVMRLQAQVAELSEAEAVIKEWSDYAEGLAGEKSRLEETVRGLEAQLAATASTQVGATPLRQPGSGPEQPAEALQLQIQQLTQQLDAATARSSAAGELEHQVRELSRQLVAATAKAAAVVQLEQQLQELTRQLERATEQGPALASREREAAELRQQLKTATARAAEATERCQMVERRAEAAETRAAEAERGWHEASGRADAAEARARGAEVAAADAALASASALMAVSRVEAAASTRELEELPQPADSQELDRLRGDIARLEAALLGLRSQLEAGPPSAASNAGPAAAAASGRTRVLRGAMLGDGTGPAGSTPSDEEALPSSPRSWAREVERLRAQNAALEVTVAGLRASLAIAMQPGGAAGDEAAQLRAQLAQAMEVRGLRPHGAGQ